MQESREARAPAEPGAGCAWKRRKRFGRPRKGGAGGWDVMDGKEAGDLAEGNTVL